MITPAYSATATERVLPRLALDFTTGVLDSRVTVTRALNTATRTNSLGVLEIVNADLPRFDYDPTTLAPKGILIEEQAANLLLNSLIDGTALSTQTRSLSAIAHTFSFYGTGSVAISGGHTATVNGTGAYPSRTAYTFTPSAGNVTFTVTGDVKFAQLETRVYASSFIPTAGTAVTRNADNVIMTGTNFSDWFNQTEGSFGVWFDTIAAGAAANIWALSAPDAVPSGRYMIGGNPSNLRGFVSASGSTQADMFNGTIANNTLKKAVLAYKTDSFAFSTGGLAPTTDNLGTLPTPTRMWIGQYNGTYLNGHVAKLMYWKQRIINAETQAFSK